MLHMEYTAWVPIAYNTLIMCHAHHAFYCAHIRIFTMINGIMRKK
jgi:hypothetical protein